MTHRTVSTRRAGSTILITGARGRLGTAMTARFAAGGHAIHAFGRELDVSDHRAIAQTVDRLRPDILIN